MAELRNEYTEVLERQLDDTWGLVGKAEGANFSNMFLAIMMTLCFVGVWTFGPNVWFGVVASLSWASTAVFQPILQSHFSKKYMRLANGR